MPVIRLPDGSQRSFDAPVSVADVAMNIGAGLAKAALAGKVNNKIVDTSYIIENDIACINNFAVNLACKRCFGKTCANIHGNIGHANRRIKAAL